MKAKDPAPTKKGLAISPQLWLQFRAAVMIQEGWIDKEDLENQNE
jgi:hypothetical protein